MGKYLELLEIEAITFHLKQREDMRKRMPDMSLRDPSGSGKALFTGNVPTPDSMNDDPGGGGAFTSPTDYIKVLHSLLANDGKVLQSKCVDALFAPQLTSESHEALMTGFEDPELRLPLGDLPIEAQLDYGLGGLIILGVSPGWRRKGTLT